MERKEFLSKTILAGGSLLAGSSVLAGGSPVASAGPTTMTPAAGAPFHLNYGIHDGMFRQHAGPEFTAQIRFAYEQGFRAIEDNGMMDRTPEQQARIGDTLQHLGMTMGVFVLNFDHWPLSTSLCSGDAALREKFLSACRAAVDGTAGSGLEGEAALIRAYREADNFIV